MSRLLPISLVAALLVTGCGGINSTRQSSSLPVRYDNAKYGLTFFLPASWRGYAVFIKPFDAPLSSTNYQNQIGIEHLQIITLRNPQWTTNAPCKDIPIMIYTYPQWAEEQQGRLDTLAGGYMEELWHNKRYVFALPNRYYIVENDNNGRELKGVQEAADIIKQNCSAHKVPPLYPER